MAGDREALVCGETRLTYRDFLQRLERLHTVLSELGARPRDRVAVLASNSIPFIELYCGISASGRSQVPLNFRWAEPELAYALSDSGARILVTDREPGALADLVDRVVRIDGGEYDELVAAAPRTPFDDAAVHEDEPAGLFYTGGTTGASKGVILTHRNLIANATSMQIVTPLELDDVYLVMAPLFHAAGSVSVLQTLYVGAKHVILP